MRVYFEKPRTTVGWKGYINDPHLDGSFAHQRGPARARASCCSSWPRWACRPAPSSSTCSARSTSPTWSAGARSARAPPRARATASWPRGLSCPVGFKNGTDGSVQVAADAILAARAPHAFMGMTKMGQAAIFETRGNDDCHVILRGGKAPNYDAGRRRGGLRGAARGRPARAGDDRLLARQQRARSTAADRGRPTTWRRRSPPASGASSA